MKLEDECLPCQAMFAERTLRHAGVNWKRIEPWVREISGKIAGEWKNTPAHYGTFIFKEVQKMSGKRDLFGEEKKKQNEKGAELLPLLHLKTNSSKNRLLYALKISAAGNVIDLGSGAGYNIENELCRLDDLVFTVDDSSKLMEEAENSRSLLFVADNCGEIFFDKVLLEILVEKIPEIYVAVKSGPILNDATMPDALEAGLDKIATVVETGSDFLGAPWDRISDKLREVAMGADIVIGKGHANAETMDEWDRPVYMLLRAKCDVVARHVGVKKGDFVLKCHRKPENVKSA